MGGFVVAGAVVLASLGSSSGGINPPLLGTLGSPGLDFTHSEVAFFLASDVVLLPVHQLNHNPLATKTTT